MAASALDPEVRARLNLAKLRAVTRAHTGLDAMDERPLGALAAVVVGDDGYVLITEGAGIGAALAWARRQRVAGRLNVFVDDAGPDAAATTGSPGVIARRATFFASRPAVFRLAGAEAHAAEPAPHRPPVAAEPAALAAVEPLRAAGAEIVVEHGVVMAELAGLEVGRVVPDPEAGGYRLELGVGRYDREAGRVMEAVLSTDGLTRNVLDVVRSHRQRGAPPHMLTRIGRQRWLRAQLLAHPELVGASRLEPLEPPLPRDNLVDPVPAFAAGETTAGRPVVVACAVGVDLEAVPSAADGRDRFDPHAELVYASPARDLYPVIGELAAALVEPARVVPLDGEWTD